MIPPTELDTLNATLDNLRALIQHVDKNVNGLTPRVQKAEDRLDEHIGYIEQLQKSVAVLLAKDIAGPVADNRDWLIEQLWERAENQSMTTHQRFLSMHSLLFQYMSEKEGT